MTAPRPPRDLRPGAGAGFLVVVLATLAGSAAGRLPGVPSVADAGFLVGCLVAPLVVRREAAVRLALLPALAYATVMVVRAVVAVGTGPTAALTTVTGLVAGAPVMLAGTVLALVVAACRVRSRRAPAPAGQGRRASRLP